METKLFPAALLDPVALEQGAIHFREGLQLALQPGSLRLAWAIAGFWGGNLIHQAWAVAPGWLAPSKGGIEAQHFQGPLHAFGLFELVNSAVQGPGEAGAIEGCCALAPPLFDQAPGPLVQFPQAPGGFERLVVVPLVVQDRPADVGHGKAA